MAQPSNGSDLNANQQQQQQWTPNQPQQQWMAMQYPAAAMVMMQQQMMMYPQHYMAYNHHPHYQQQLSPYQQQLKQLSQSHKQDEIRTIWVGDLHHWMDENYLHGCFAYTGQVGFSLLHLFLFIFCLFFFRSLFVIFVVLDRLFLLSIGFMIVFSDSRCQFAIWKLVVVITRIVIKIIFLYMLPFGGNVFDSVNLCVAIKLKFEALLTI